MYTHTDTTLCLVESVLAKGCARLCQSGTSNAGCNQGRRAFCRPGSDQRKADAERHAPPDCGAAPAAKSRKCDTFSEEQITSVLMGSGAARRNVGKAGVRQTSHKWTGTRSPWSGFG